jgi:hypothetical protein
MSEDDYLTLPNPTVLLQQTARWGITCYRCASKRPRGKPCASCGDARYCRRPSERRLRLIACAIWRFARDEYGEDISDESIAAAERYSEGKSLDPALLVQRTGREAAFAALHHARTRTETIRRQQLATTLNDRLMPALQRASDFAARGGPAAVKRACKTVARHYRESDEKETRRLAAQDRSALCDILRDILGNPYRLVSIKPDWLDANRRLARAIAEDIDETGQFDDLPVLADALEEGGCTDERILSHARQPRHYRGCWLIDSILSKE